MENRASAIIALNWFLQRITGIFLTFFLIVHIIVLHFMKTSEINFETMSARISGSTLWFIFYGLFILTAVYHGLNGTWNVISDYKLTKKILCVILPALWILGIAGFIGGLIVLNGLIFH